MLSVNRRKAAVAVLLLAVALPGCATRRFAVSTIPSPGAVGGSAGEGVRLRLSGLAIELEPSDVSPLDSQRVPVDARPLRVVLRVRSQELGYLFKPERVVLRRGTESFPAQLAHGSECREAGVAGSAEDGWLWLTTRACLVLEFTAAVTPEPGQFLVLDGLARGQQPIPPVTLPLRRREVQVRELTPGARNVLSKALIVPLYILMAPLYLAGGGM